MSSLLRATWFAGLTSLANIISQVLKGKAQAVILGTSGMGVLSQVLYFFNISNIVAGLGLSEGVVRYTSQYSAQGEREKLESFYVTIFSVLVCSAVVVLCLVSFLADYFSIALFGNDKYSPYIILVVGAIPFAIIARFFNSVLRGLREVKTIARISIYANFTTLPIAIFLTYLYQIFGAIIGLILLHLVTLVVGYFFILQGDIFSLKKISLNHIEIKLFTLNKWYSVTSIVITIMSNLTIIYVSRMIVTNMGIDQNGIYAVTIKVSSVYFGMLVGAATTYYYPTLCGLNDHVAISSEINDTLYYYLVILTPVLVGLIVFNQLIIAILFSSKFLFSGTLLAYHLPGDMFRIAYETMGLSLLAKGRLKIYICLYAVWCVLYILFAKLMGGAFGLIGFSCAYTLSYCIITFLTYSSISRAFRFRINKKTLTFLILSFFCIFFVAANNIYIHSNIKYIFGSLILIFWGVLVCKDPAFKKCMNRFLERWRMK